jgi:hypothetical protein
MADFDATRMIMTDIGDLVSEVVDEIKRLRAERDALFKVCNQLYPYATAVQREVIDAARKV